MELFGTINEDELQGNISYEELENILCWALDIDEYFKRLKSILQNKLGVSGNNFPLSDYLKAMEIMSRDCTLPITFGGRGAYTNLLLIRTAVYYFKQGQLKNSQIRQGMVAFNVTSRLYSTDGVPVKTSRILKALKMANKIMPMRKLEVWLDKYGPYLMDRLNNSVDEKDNKDKPKKKVKKRENVLYPHEFIIIMAQSKDYSAVMDKVYSEVNDRLFNHANETLKKAEVNGFEKFLRNQQREYLDVGVPEKSKIFCRDIPKLQRTLKGKYNGLKIMDVWEENYKTKKVFEDSNNPKRKNEENEKIEREKEVIGLDVLNRKQEILGQLETFMSLHSLSGLKPQIPIFMTQFQKNERAQGFPQLRPSMKKHEMLRTTEYKSQAIEQKKPINFIAKNRQLIHCHPGNREKFRQFRASRCSRPSTAVTQQTRKDTMASTLRFELMSKASSLFDEELYSTAKLGGTQQFF